MPRISVKVIPNAKMDSVEDLGDKLKVRLKAPAVDGRANEALIKVLSEYFGVRKNHVKIILGEKSREKVVDIQS